MNTVRFGAKAYMQTQHLSGSQKQMIHDLRQHGATNYNRTVQTNLGAQIAITVVDDNGNAKANEGLIRLLKNFSGFGYNFSRHFQAAQDAGLEKTEVLKGRDAYVYDPNDNVTPEAEQAHLKHFATWYGLESGG